MSRVRASARRLKYFRTSAHARGLIQELGCRRDDAQPAYLLGRSGAGERPDFSRILCLAGGVRSHVTVSELGEWAAALERNSISLEVLDGQACELVLDGAEWLRIQAQLAEAAVAFEQASAAWEETREQASAWTREVEHAARHGCGRRVPADPCVSPSFRAYDLLYLPPPSGDLMQPGVIALVVHVCAAFGMGAPGRVPTGDIDVIHFDCSTRKFSQELQRVRDVGWELMPPCCGRGAACPHLGRMAPEARQWRSGEHMDIRSLLDIPRALRSWLQPRALACGRDMPSVPQHLCPQDALLMMYGVKLCSCCGYVR